MSQLVKKQNYFYTFDFYRFCAFMIVFLCHIPFKEGSVASLFSKSGGSGVFFFFTLSGFLITYLLLTERYQNGQIHLKNFFMRRVLRIWPLYYAMILFAYFSPCILSLAGLSSSQEGYEPNWWLNILFLDNYKAMITKSFPNVSPLAVMWSLCVEEHFYIIWGLAFRYIPPIWYKPFIVLSVMVSLVTLGIYAWFNIDPGDILSNLVFFGSGSYLAYLYFHNGAFAIWDKISVSFKAIIVAILFLAVFAINTVEYAVWISYLIIPVVSALIFTALISITLSNGSPLHIPKTNLLTRLGVYTYGLYLFHTIIINFYLRIWMLSEVNSYLLLMIVSLITTILVAVTSYYWFEKPFLRLKRYFR